MKSILERLTDIERRLDSIDIDEPFRCSAKVKRGKVDESEEITRLKYIIGL